VRTSAGVERYAAYFYKKPTTLKCVPPAFCVSQMRGTPRTGLLKGDLQLFTPMHSDTQRSLRQRFPFKIDALRERKHYLSSARRQEADRQCQEPHRGRVSRAG
jgi:hypothetical protein